MGYEDQLSAAKFKAGRDNLAQAVQGVCEDMEAHVLGVEGMEDAPVARWDRDLRAALGGMREAVEHAMKMDPNAQRLLQEDDDAAKWVREHGGLYQVRDAYNDLRNIVDDLGIEWCESDAYTVYTELEKRLMPEGCEWPRYEDGSLVMFGDETYVTEAVESITFEAGGITLIGDKYGDFAIEHGERVKRLQVIAADGEPLEVGQTVYTLDDDRPYTVRLIDGDRASINAGKGALNVWYYAYNLTHQRPVLDADGNLIETGMDVWWVCEGDERGIHAEKLHVERIRGDGFRFVECSPFNGGKWVELEPIEIYVRKPVLDADGVPIKVGDTVYVLGALDEYKVINVLDNENVGVEFHDSWLTFLAKGLTHTKPEPDSWERIKEDAEKDCCDYFGHSDWRCTSPSECPPHKSSRKCFNEMACDLVRRCKALAGVSE